MGNMAYCRFHNTAIDLQDCLNHINDELEGEEKKARAQLVTICQDIIDAFENEDEEAQE